MQYGNKSINSEKLYLYQGFDPADVNFTPNEICSNQMEVVNQRDADLVFLWKWVISQNGVKPLLEDRVLD